jgi:hypothetical protein
MAANPAIQLPTTHHDLNVVLVMISILPLMRFDLVKR